MTPGPDAAILLTFEKTACLFKIPDAAILLTSALTGEGIDDRIEFLPRHLDTRRRVPAAGASSGV